MGVAHPFLTRYVLLHKISSCTHRMIATRWGWAYFQLMELDCLSVSVAGSSVRKVVENVEVGWM